MERVFKWFTKESQCPKSNIYTYWFANHFTPDNFEGVDRLLMCYLQYCAKLSVVPSKPYLTAYLKVDGKQDIKKHNVRTDTMTSLDYRESSQLEEAYRIISGAAQASYDNYVAVDLTDRDFKVDVYGFMRERRAELVQETMMKAYPKLTDGSDPNEVSAELRNSLAELDVVYDTEAIRDIEFTHENPKENEEMVFIAKTGIPCVDGDVGGIYTSLIYTLNAQPGSGKTRMQLVHFVYPVLVHAKKDVLYYETELSRSQVENILIAYHIVQIYGGRVKIPDSVMNKKQEMTDEQRQIYESAKIDLFESGKYGNFIFRGELIVEKYEDEALGIVKANPNIMLIGIDYMGLCHSKPQSKWAPHMEQFEIITEAYEITRRILKRIPCAAICNNQYNDKGIDAAYAGKQIRSGHVQGGHIVQRHTDYDMSMTFTEEQELAGIRMMSISKKRGAKGFKNVMFSTDLSVSIFRQEVTK